MPRSGRCGFLRRSVAVVSHRTDSRVSVEYEKPLPPPRALWMTVRYSFGSRNNSQKR